MTSLDTTIQQSIRRRGTGCTQPAEGVHPHMPRSGLIIATAVLNALLLTGTTSAAERRSADQPAGAAEPPQSIAITDRVPFGRQPVDYFGPATDDAVAQLNRRLAAGSAELTADDTRGYLPAVLALLDVPVESQVLVYSKTARAPELVSPATPRAIFFNDKVTVAWIPEARELELTAVAPIKGVNFYTLSQPLENGAETQPKKNAPTFLRRDRCLACHAGRSSLEVPGLLLRAFQTDSTGKPLYGFSRVTHDMKYTRRWGGWYVTGAPAGLVHRGNLVSKEDNAQHKLDAGFRSQSASLSELTRLTSGFDVDLYPYGKSDLIAHLVLAHQAHGTNLLIRAGMEARLNRRSDVEDQLLRYFTFADEPPLSLSPETATAVLQNSKYASWFASQGPRDPEERSLRDVDLTRGVFQHRLSFLIHSPLFDALPVDCRSRLLTRLWEGLTTKVPEESFRHLEARERAAIVSIVRHTVPRLPACWK